LGEDGVERAIEEGGRPQRGIDLLERAKHIPCQHIFTILTPQLIDLLSVHRGKDIVVPVNDDIVPEVVCHKDAASPPFATKNYFE
jgi:hypothetical protein